MAINVENPQKVFLCHAYECKFRVNLLTLMHGWLTGSKPTGEKLKALSWLNLLFEVSAYAQRYDPKVDFLGLVVQRLAGGRGTARSAFVVPSRHPGRYPKLESSTLSHPALEPLTEHHAL